MKINSNWTNREHNLGIIRKLLFELTGYDGKIKVEHLIIKDIGLDSLDWIEFFTRLQKLSKSNLGRKELNTFFGDTLASTNDDSYQDVSLLSRLKVAHLLTYLEQQLRHPLDHQDFIYSNWKEKFFPKEQSYQPTFQTWGQLVNSLTRGNNYLKTDNIEPNSKELEILEFFWLKDELGILILEGALNNMSDKLSEIGYLNTTLSNFLKDENLLYNLRIELANKCLNHTTKALHRIHETGDDWRWIIENFISDKFNTIDLKQWIKYTNLKTPENKNEYEKLIQIIHEQLVDFISKKIDQLIPNWTTTNSKNQSLTHLVSLTQRCQNYLEQQFKGLIEEFLEIFTEEFLYDSKFDSISKHELSQMQPVKNQYESQKPNYNMRFEKLAINMVEDSKNSSRTHEILQKEPNKQFQEELSNLKHKWSSPLKFLIRFPQLGSIGERISLLMTTQTDWEKFLDKNISKQSERLKITFFACLFQKHGWNRHNFENEFLKTALNWQDLQLKLKKQDSRKLILRIEDVWAGIDLNIAGQSFSALEIFIRFGIKMFEHDSPHKLFKWLSNPTDQDLINLTEAYEIQSLNRFL
ncbi:MAG: hypothetical protein VX619_02410 [bacterium]|nr:hypothetical protein [bacterium]